MAELLTTYASLRLQVVDACIVALAERLNLREVAVLDRRDLLVVAPRHLHKGDRLTLHRLTAWASRDDVMTRAARAAFLAVGPGPHAEQDDQQRRDDDGDDPAPFWDAVEGRAPVPAAATLGWELVSVSPGEGTIEVKQDENRCHAEQGPKMTTRRDAALAKVRDQLTGSHDSRTRQVRAPAARRVDQVPEPCPVRPCHPEDHLRHERRPVVSEADAAESHRRRPADARQAPRQAAGSRTRVMGGLTKRGTVFTVPVR